MRSTIYLNHYPDAILRNEEAVTADLTMSIGDLGARTTRTGAFMSDVLSTLAIRQLDAPQPSDMLLIGSQEQIVSRQKRLTCDIGRIADRAMAVEAQWGSPSLSTLENWGYNIAAYTVPGIARDNSPFIDSVGRILKVVGEDCNDDGCEYAFGLRPGWFQQTGERQERFHELGDTVPTLLARIPEYNKDRHERTTYERVLLYRVGGWLSDNADRFPTTAEARYVEEFDTMVHRERDAIAKVVTQLHARGLPEQFYLAPDIWERLIAATT